MLSSLLLLDETKVEAFPEKVIEATLSVFTLPEDLQQLVLDKLALKGVTEITEVRLLNVMYRSISMIALTNTGKIHLGFNYSFNSDTLRSFRFSYQRLSDSEPAPLETLIDYKAPLTE